MATALITIDQPLHTTTPKGPRGRARDDLELSKPVVCKNSDNTDVTRWRWTMRDRPLGSAAVLSDPTAPEVTFVPDVEGSYRISLSINDGGAHEIDTKVAAVRTVEGFRYAATGEQASEANWLISGATNSKGWGKDTEDILRQSVAGTETLAATLASGNTTGGTPIVVTAGDSINGESGGQVTFVGPGNIELNPDATVAVGGDLEVTGKLTVSGLIDPTGLVLDEQASSPAAHEAGKGTLWVKNDTPNKLYFTDDVGTDFVLATADDLAATGLSDVLASGNTTGGTNIQLTNNDAIVGQDGGSIAFDTGSGLITTSELCVGDPGTENGGITIGGVTYQAALKVSDLTSAHIGQLILHRHSLTLPPIIATGRSHSTGEGHAIVQNGDGLLELYATGWDGTDYAFGGLLGFAVDGTPGNDDMPTRFFIRLSEDGTQNLTERFEIAPDGTTTVSGDLVVDGKLTVSGLIDPTGLVLDEQASSPAAPEAGKGTLWISNTATQRVNFTDEAGTTTTLATTAEASAVPPLANVLGSGNATGGTSIEITNNDAIVGQDGGSISFTASSGAVTLGGGASETVRVRTSDFVPVTNNGAYLGNPSLRWIGIYSGSVSAQVLQGYDFGSGVGAGAAVTFRGGNGGTAGGSGADAIVQAGSALAGDSKGGTLTIRSGNGSGTENAGNLQLSSGSVVTGDLGVVRITNTCLEIAEAAAVPGTTITAGYGRLWIRNDATAMFTDDGARDIELSRSPIITLGSERARLSASTAPILTEVAGVHPSLQFDDAQTSTCHWYDSAPVKYVGGSLTVRILWSGSLGDDAKRVVWQLKIENMIGSTLGTDGSQTHTLTIPGPAVANTLLASEETYSNAQMDGIGAGDMFRVELSRLGNHASDDYNAPAFVIGIQIFQ